MRVKDQATRFDEELGKALCDRLGLRHNDTMREWSSESAGKTVWVTMTTMKAVTQDEFSELCKVAADRANQ